MTSSEVTHSASSSDAQVHAAWSSVAGIATCLHDEAQKCINFEQRQRLRNYADQLSRLAKKAQVRP